MTTMRARLTGAVLATAVAATTSLMVMTAPIAAAAGPTMIAGVVTDSSTGAPVGGVEVDVVIGSSLQPGAATVASAVTDASGGYSIALAGLATAADPVTVDLVDPAGAFGVSYSNAVTLVDDDTVFAPFALDPGAVVTGTVTGGGGGALAGSCVTVRDGATRLVLPAGGPGSCSDASGGYSLPALAAGTYTFTFSSPDLALWNSIPAQQVTVTAGVPAVADAALLPVRQTSITGVVTDFSTSAPLGGIEVTATTTDAAGTPQTLNATTDAAGAFTLAIGFQPGAPFVIDVVDPTGAHHPATGITISVQTGYTEAIGVTLQPSNVTPTADVSARGATKTLIIGQPDVIEVSVTNAGPTVATGVTLTTQIPLTVAVDRIDAPSGFSCSVAALQLTCTAPALGVQRTAVVRLAVSPGGPGSFYFPQTVVSTTSIDPDPSNNTSFNFLSVQDLQADLWVTLDNRPLQVGVSAPITFGVRNEGPATAQDVFAVVRLPEGLIVDRVEADGWTCAVDGREVGCSAPSLAANGQLLARAFVTPTTPGTALPIASSVGSSTPDFSPWTNGVDTTFDVVPVGSVDLGIGSRPFFGQVVAGRPVTVSFGVSNSGPATANDVVVTADVPTALRINAVTSDSGILRCDVADQLVTCSSASLPAGASEVLRFDVTPIVVGGPVVLTAAVASSSPEVGVQPDVASFGPVDVVEDVVDLAVTTNVQPLAVGVSTALSVIVSNLGAASAVDVDVTVTVPAGFAIDAVSPGFGATCSTVGQTVSCRAPQAPSFGLGFVIATISVTADVAGSYEIVSEVTSPARDSDPTNNRTIAPVQVIASTADLGVFASAFFPTQVGQGGLLSVSVSNVGPTAASNVSVVVRLPEPFTPVRADTPGWSCVIDGQVVTCTTPTVFPFLGAGFAVFYTAVGVGAGDANVSVSSDTSDPNTLNDTSSAQLIAFAPEVDLSLFGSQGGSAVDGEPAHAFVSLFNPSSFEARDVVLDVTATGGTIESLTLFGFDCGLRADGSGRCNSASVFPGQFGVLDVTVVSSAGASAVTIDATVSSSTSDSFPFNNATSVTLPVVPRGTADLAAQLFTTPSDFVVGVQQDIRIGVSNFGPGTVDAATATFVSPSALQIVGVSADPGVSCVIEVSTVTCTAAGLLPGTNAGVDVTVLPLSESFFGGSMSVTVSGATSDPNPFNDSSFATVFVSRNEADLILSASSPTAVTAVGERVSVPLSVFNNGPARAAGVAISVEFPSTLAYAAAPGSLACAEGGPGTLTCALPDVPRFSSQFVSVQFDAVATSDDARVTATIISATDDPALGNNSVSTSYRIAPAGSVDLVAGAPQVFAAVVGQPLTVAVTARHAGPSASPAETVRLVSVFPAAVQVDSVTPSLLFPDASCSFEANTVTCEVASLAPSFEFVAFVALTPVSPAPFPTITVSVSSATPDPVPGNDEAFGFIEALPNTADLSVSGGGPATIDVGASDFLTANVFNVGFAPAFGAVLRISPQPGVSVTSAVVFGAASPCVADGEAWDCPLGDVSRFGQLFGSFMVTGLDPGTTSVTLTVSADNDVNPDNDTAVVPVEVIPSGTSDLFVDLSSSTLGVDGRQLVTASFGQLGPSRLVESAELRIDTPGLQPGDLFTFGADMTCLTEQEAVVCSLRQIGLFTRGLVSFETRAIRDQFGAQVTATITGSGTDPNPGNNIAISAPYDARITPLQPSTPFGIPRDRAVELGWGGGGGPFLSPTIDYLVEYSTDGGATWSRYADEGPSEDPAIGITVTGLANGVSYVFRVAAVNEFGQGPWSDTSAPVTPSLPPRTPAKPEARAGNQQVTLSWRAPSQRGRNPIIDYVIQYSSDRGRTWTTFDDGVSAGIGTVVTGLTNGTRYTFRVAAVNDAGQSRFSDESNAVTPRRR